ncbi:MAG: hypothetical protein ACI4V1_04870 [Eubacteriales bacterium]
MKGRNLKEYSKQIIHAMIVLWFAGAVFGAAVIVVELAAALCSGGYEMALTIHLPELLTYIGAPMGCGIVGYLLKSAFENKEKIKNNPGYVEPMEEQTEEEIYEYNQLETEIDQP